MIEKEEPKKKICWITPDYFLLVDSGIVPSLTNDYNISWIIIYTKNSPYKASQHISGSLDQKKFILKYKQRDPRIIFQYIKFLINIRKNKYDLIYLSFHGLPYFFPLFFLLINPERVIYGAHNVTTPKGASHEKSMRLYHGYAYKRFKNFHVFSKSQLAFIKALFPNKKHYYAPLALRNYEGAATDPPTDRIRFLFFGYIRDYKKLDLLLKSFQEVYRSGVKNIELYVAGNCENWKAYESLISNDSPIVTRIEVIPDKDVAGLVSSCHYMVLPYKDGAQSGVLSLAYQYLKPVIVSDIESFKQFVEEGSTGFTFKNGSQESLTKLMKKVIAEHESNYQLLQKNIKGYVADEFSTDTIIGKYRSFLKDCIK